ncbi:hypothetical protein BV25DRAFT_1805616 [Artomyces pyxidatus]|uniref:Uncharacterized protein n=1 Tax=Artomyces pyxidatus TaxID=48021 RepID=A0ACB8SZ26_9AGAM|nr:hypothetical protein BV25DRAFT_1805616 [Artomyces pyxidatus]
MKRLAKLQSPSSTSTPSPTPSSSTPAPAVSSPKPKSIPAPTPKRLAEPTPSPVPPKKKAPAAPTKFIYEQWENDTITDVFQVTLDPEVALRVGNRAVWLKSYIEDGKTDENDPFPDLRLNAERLEGVVIARLDLDVRSEDHDEDYRPFLAHVPRDQTVFQYLIASWKRLNSAKSALLKKGYPPVDIQKALRLEEQMRHLIISYLGIYLMNAEAFPFPQGKELGAAEFAEMLVSLSSFSNTIYGGSVEASHSLAEHEVQQFLQEFVSRFEPDGELEDMIGEIAAHLFFHECLFTGQGLAASDSQWRGVLTGLEVFLSQKSIARIIVARDQWIPTDCSPNDFENTCYMGPLMRLSVFTRDWPYVTKTYFSDIEGRPPVDLESSRNSLRGTLKSLQASLFQIFNVLIRSSPECREAVLAFFSHVVSINHKRAGMQVNPDTVSSDSFMTNLHAVLLRFAEPFMDAQFTKIDRIDKHYFAHSDRIYASDETRINATSEEAAEWMNKNLLAEGAPPPNFISDIFYLTLASNHYGFLKTVQTFDEYNKQLDDAKKHLASITGDRSWVGTPFQPRMEAAIKQVKDEIAKIQGMQAAASTQLYDPELLFRNNSFNIFVTTWLIRFVDPRKTHPKPFVELPLPKEVPLDFKVLPEYLLEDAIEYYVFLVRHVPNTLELTGKEELLTFAITFLSSTWYIKNPFLKSKLVEILFFACLPYRGSEGPSLLGSTLNTHKVALQHLIPALMHFYIEVEQTGASSQFYDKFSARNIAYVLKVVWSNPEHRKALKEEAKLVNIEKFVRFVNLMINDVTYLMDESLSDLAQIYNIQTEMENEAEWQVTPAHRRRELEQNLRNLERQATGYTQLGKSTVDLLRIFTAETKEPFMMPEIVDRLAAMLDYNLDALVGPKCQDLRVKNKEKYHFNPRQLLSDILQVYLNLGDQGEFVQAVAGDGRSYRKELFEKAAYIAARNNLKSPSEIEHLRQFVVKVEEAKATIEAEEELGEIPDEFLDPLMFTVMRDPVTLPTSRAIIDRSTIKSHLLSDSKDPFNRAPLSIDDVIPNPELKQRIQEFLAARRNKDTALDKPEADVVKMDVDSPEKL